MPLRAVRMATKMVSELWDVPRSAIRTPLRDCFCGSDGKREADVLLKPLRGCRRRHCDERDTGCDDRDVREAADVRDLVDVRYGFGAATEDVAALTARCAIVFDELAMVICLDKMRKYKNSRYALTLSMR